MNERAQPDAYQDGIESKQGPQPRCRLQPQQTSYVVRSQNRLDTQQQTISPGAEVIAVLGVQSFRAVAVLQVPVQVALTIGFPPDVGRRQVGDPKARAYPVKHIVELGLLVRAQGPSEQLMRSLGVINEHVEHITVSPIRDGLAALALDGVVCRPDPIERARGGQFVGEDDPLSVARGDEEPADGIARQFPGEEQPVDRTVEGELGGRPGEDEEDSISISPNPPHDGIPVYEIGH